MTEQLSAEEHKRRRRERYIIVAVAAAIFILTYIETHISNIGSNLPAATNIIVFGLININIILLILLVFLRIRKTSRIRRIIFIFIRPKTIILVAAGRLLPILEMWVSMYVRIKMAAATATMIYRSRLRLLCSSADNCSVIG